MAQYRFIRKCLKAFKRDLKELIGENRAARDVVFQENEFPVAESFRALVFDEDARAAFLDGWSEMSSEELDGATAAKVLYMETLLRPWFKGKHRLDYDKLTGVSNFLEAIAT